MRRRLVEATLDSLSANGYAGASLSDILGRAGVSRGAWAHHFASKGELVALAAEDMLFQSVAAARSVAAMTPDPGQDRLDLLLEAAWSRFYQGRHRDVLFEVALACRTDADLQSRLAPVFRAFIAAVGESWGASLGQADLSPARLGELMTMSVYLLRGMSIQEVATGGGSAAEHRALRRLWATMMRDRLAAGSPCDRI